MRNSNLIVSAAVAVSAIVGIGAASAADLPVKSYVKAQPIDAVYNWSGFYLGVNAGYGQGVKSDPDLTFVDPGISGLPEYFAGGGNVTPNIAPHGLIAGGQIGFNAMLGSNWVVGAVADLQSSDLRASGTNVFARTGFATSTQTNSVQIDWFGTLRAKLGYAANNWLFYGTGGLAYGRIKPAGIFNVEGTNILTGSTDTTKAGWAAGAGVQYAIAPNWIIGVEYLYFDLGRAAYTEVNPGNPLVTITINDRAAAHIGRLSLDYKF
jgi:outer membrane immunogenic protein